MLTHEKNYIKELKEAIKNETYDEFMDNTGKDVWEIIEDLLSVVERLETSREENKNENKTP